MPLVCRRGNRSFILAAVASVTFWTAACGDGATGPAPTPNRAPVPGGSIPAQTVAVGETATVNVSSYFSDPDGDALTYAAASSNAATASVAVSGSVVTVTAVARGVATVTVTARDPGGLSAQLTFPVTVPNQAPVAAGTVPAQTVFVGGTVSVDMSTHFSDPDGDALHYSGASSNAAVVSASFAGSVMSLGGIAQGTVTVTVTARDPGGLSVQQSLVVTVPNRAPAASGSISARTISVGQTFSLDVAAYFDDPDGETLTYSAASSAARVASVTVEGSSVTVAGVGEGMAMVTVTATDSGQLSAQQRFPVTVTPGQSGVPVVISGIEPSVLVEGANATITGSGFSASAAQNQVSVGGLAATVTSAGTTSLSIVIPRADCLPPRRDELRVSVGSRTDARTVGVTPRSQDLPQGHYTVTRPGDGCIHLPGSTSGGEYLIGVLSVSENPASLTGFTLNGIPGDATVVAAARGRILVAAEPEAAQETSTRAVAAFAGGPFRPAAALHSTNGFDELPLADDTLRMRRARAHNEIMARNAALMGRLGRAARPALADARRELQVGDTLTLYADGGRTTCTSSGQVRAVVRLVGNSAIWLDDRENPAETFTDSELVDLDAFHADNVKDIHDDYYGGLSDVDGNGRFLVLMTKEVNRLEGVLGFVWAGDLLRKADCATSNQAEIFYGMVPDPHGSAGDTVTKEAVLDEYPALIAHELTHLVQASALIHHGAGGRARKERWEREGGATLAEQLVAYRLFGHGSGRELGWAAYAASDASRAWYNAWLLDVVRFFGYGGNRTGRIAGAPEECSWVGLPDDGNSGPCLGGSRAIYGVPSMVLRYAMDRWGEDHPGGERGLMRRFTSSPVRGFQSLVDVSPDRSWRTEQILADFYISLWLDMQAEFSAPGMTTWNLHDIFDRLVPATRLQPATSSSTSLQLAGRRVRAGSSLYLHWTPTGALRPTSLKVTSADGGRVSGHLSVWALRVR